MKKLIVASPIFLTWVSAMAQGNFIFNNYVPPSINAPFRLSIDTGASSSVVDSRYSWQLEGGAHGTSLADSEVLASGIFRDDGSGYVVPPNHLIPVPGQNIGVDADIFVSIFPGPTPTGKSLADFGPFAVVLDSPPGLGNPLPLGTSPLVINVPEPGTLLLGGLGVFMVLIFLHSTSQGANMHGLSSNASVSS